MSEPRKLPFTGRFRIHQADGKSYTIEPIRELPSAMYGPLIEARFERRPGLWDVGCFRRDLIVSMEPQLGEAA